MNSYLSDDLVDEILSRLPATSLKRLRSTCKRWNLLFNDGQFIKKHSDKAAKEFYVLIYEGGKSYLTNVNLRVIHNIDPTIEVTRQVFTDYELGFFGCNYFQIFPCNGLFLFMRTRTSSFVVYNPCTKQTRWIKLRSFYSFIMFALGYKNNNSSCCNNYKILRIPDGIKHVFEIYEFESNSWRVLDDVTRDWHITPEDRGVSLKGNTYWVASVSEAPLEVDDFLLKFDFTKERFQRLGLPFKCYYRQDTVALSTIREEKLAVLFQRRDKPTMEIWLANIKIDNDVVWSMLFTLDLNNEYMFSSSTSFMVDEENKVAVCCDTSRGENYGNSRIHIVGEDQFREVDLRGGYALFQERFLPRPFLFSYAPSLVQI